MPSILKVNCVIKGGKPLSKKMFYKFRVVALQLDKQNPELSCKRKYHC
jgi:hypothetical protein